MLKKRIPMVLELEMFHTIKLHLNVREQDNHGSQKIGQKKI